MKVKELITKLLDMDATAEVQVKSLVDLNDPETEYIAPAKFTSKGNTISGLSKVDDIVVLECVKAKARKK